MKETINNLLKQNWFKIGLLVILIVFVSSIFYWYEWRPSQIRIECWEKVKTVGSNAKLSVLDTERLLNICLVGEGLKL